jgi:GntR family transcriptional repressor for pyruvate dehydrogenase complex
LPSEGELAKRLDVSRTTIREALRILEIGGLIQTKQGKGSIVLETSLGFIKEAMDRLIKDQSSEFEYLMQAREVLEPVIAGYSAKEANTESLRKMEESLLNAEEEISKGGTGIEGAIRFHHEIVNSIENKILSSITNMVINLIERSTHLTFNIPSRPGKSLEEHIKILKAIKGSDSNAAAQFMKEHLESVKRNLEKVLGEK